MPFGAPNTFMARPPQTLLAKTPEVKKSSGKKKQLLALAESDGVTYDWSDASSWELQLGLATNLQGGGMQGQGGRQLRTSVVSAPPRSIFEQVDAAAAGGAAGGGAAGGGAAGGGAAESAADVARAAVGLGGGMAAFNVDTPLKPEDKAEQGGGGVGYKVSEALGGSTALRAMASSLGNSSAASELTGSPGHSVLPGGREQGDNQPNEWHQPGTYIT